MNLFTTHYSSLMHALGWTLLNSVWQAAILFAMLLLALRFVPHRFSKFRYAISCGSLALLVISSGVTFTFLYESSPTSSTIDVVQWSGITNNTEAQPISTSVIDSTINWVQLHMQFVIAGWMAGAFIFALRLLSGWGYVARLRRNASVIQADWQTRLAELMDQLGITNEVILAKSSEITVPMVVGFFKPMILVPTYMFTGLSPAQIETVLLHELAHIRRNDFVINLIQSIVESIFFFNPFVWILSSIIRREREFCCDDEVVINHGQPLVYAQALASLEELRFNNPSLTLALAENKNLLYNRIRRIMERSAKNYKSSERVVPAVLVVLGLVCASWLTIQTEKSETVNLDAIAQDTTIKKDNKTEYSKTTIITFDEKGEPHERVIENFEGDDDMKSYVLSMPFDFSSPMAPPRGFDAPAFPGVFSMPAFPDQVTLKLDTLPDGTYRIRNSEWQEFTEQFQARLREQFKDFYKDHEKDLDKMMKEMEENFAHRFQATEWIEAPFPPDAIRELDALEPIDAEHLIATQEALEALELTELDSREELLLTQMENIQSLNVGLEERAEAMREMELQLTQSENNMRVFEGQLQKMLVKDGYLKKDEKITSFKHEESGEMEVNGKKIKAADLDRYNALHRKFFKPGLHYYNVE
jgi:bla regulator protein blaR1